MTLHPPCREDSFSFHRFTTLWYVFALIRSAEQKKNIESLPSKVTPKQEKLILENLGSTCSSSMYGIWNPTKGRGSFGGVFFSCRYRYTKYMFICWYVDMIGVSYGVCVCVPPLGITLRKGTWTCLEISASKHTYQFESGFAITSGRVNSK